MKYATATALKKEVRFIALNAMKKVNGKPGTNGRMFAFHNLLLAYRTGAADFLPTWAVTHSGRSKLGFHPVEAFKD